TAGADQADEIAAPCGETDVVENDGALTIAFGNSVEFDDGRWRHTDGSRRSDGGDDEGWGPAEKARRRDDGKALAVTVWLVTIAQLDSSSLRALAAVRFWGLASSAAA